MATKPTRNRLLDQQHRNAAGPYINEARHSGRTTQLALSYIAKALAKPNVPVPVFDHYNPENAHSRRMMVGVCRGFVSKLNLQCFDFSDLDGTVTCNLLEW